MVTFVLHWTALLFTGGPGLAHGCHELVTKKPRDAHAARSLFDASQSSTEIRRRSGSMASVSRRLSPLRFLTTGLSNHVNDDDKCPPETSSIHHPHVFEVVAVEVYRLRRRDKTRIRIVVQRQGDLDCDLGITRVVSARCSKAHRAHRDTEMAKALEMTTTASSFPSWTAQVPHHAQASRVREREREVVTTVARTRAHSWTRYTFAPTSRAQVRL
jgi:hypothetical protein